MGVGKVKYSRPSNGEFHLVCEGRKMTKEDMKLRTKKFAVSVILASETFKNTIAGRELVKQIVRSAMSVSGNYRSACRGRSKAEWLSKLGIVEEEADETHNWLEMAVETGIAHADIVNPLLAEANSIVAIVVATIRTTRKNMQNPSDKAPSEESVDSE